MFTLEKHGVVDVIGGEEPLTLQNTEQLSSLLEECLEAGQPTAVLDLRKTKLIDSVGLELVLDAQEKFRRRGGGLKIAAPNPLCRDILMATGLDERFEVFPEVAEAVRSFLR